MGYSERAWMLGRTLFGLFFIYAAVMVTITYGGMHPPEATAAARDFTTALDRTGFFNPLLIVSMIVAGLALLFNRTAPLGLILLAPSVVVITCFHWFLTGDYLWGTVWPVWFAVLAWHYRHVFARLWAPASTAGAD